MAVRDAISNATLMLKEQGLLPTELSLSDMSSWLENTEEYKSAFEVSIASMTRALTERGLLPMQPGMPDESDKDKLDRARRNTLVHFSKSILPCEMKR